MKWNNLTMAEKAKLMLLGVSKGITDLSSIKKLYNLFKDGGEKEPNIQLAEAVVTPRVNYINYTGNETYAPSYEQFILEKRNLARANAVINMLNTTNPTVPIIPNRVGRIAQRINPSLNSKDAAFIFGRESLPATCIYTVTDKYGSLYRVSGNKTMAENPNKYGFAFTETPKEGDFMQFYSSDRFNVPYHAGMITGFNRERVPVLSQSDGGTTPESIKIDDDTWPLRNSDKIKYLTFIGTNKDLDRWKKEYSELYNNRGIRGNKFTEGGPTNKKAKNSSATKTLNLGETVTPELVEVINGVYLYLTKNKGLSKAAASAIMGNIWQESRFNVNAVNKKSQAAGLLLLLGNHKKMYDSYVANNKVHPQYGLLDYILYALNNPDTYDFYTIGYNKLKKLVKDAQKEWYRTFKAYENNKEHKQVKAREKEYNDIALYFNSVYGKREKEGRLFPYTDLYKALYDEKYPLDSLTTLWHDTIERSNSKEANIENRVNAANLFFNYFNKGGFVNKYDGLTEDSQKMETLKGGWKQGYSYKNIKSVRDLLLWLYYQGFAPKGMSEKKFIDDKLGPITKAALEKAFSEGFIYDGQNWGIVNNYKKESDTSKYKAGVPHYHPSHKNELCEDEECAKYANEELNNFLGGSYFISNNGTKIYGHAWTRSALGDTKDYISGYDYMTRNMKNSSDNKFNKEAADSLKAHFGEFTMDPNEVYMANMYYGPDYRSNMKTYDQAAKLGKGRTVGSHTGNVYFDNKKGEWRVNHNVHKYVYDIPLKEVLGGNHLSGITSLVRVPHKDISSDIEYRFSSPGSFNYTNYNIEPLLLNIFKELGLLIIHPDRTPLSLLPNKKRVEGTPVYYNVKEDTHLENYPEGVSLSHLGFVENPDKPFATKANVASPLAREALESAYKTMGTIADKYNLSLNEVGQLFSIMPGILWKESNGGYPLRKLGDGVVSENTTYYRKRLNTLYDKARYIAKDDNDVSEGMGNVKRRSNPILFDSPYFDIEINKLSGYFAGPNTLSALANTYINMKKMFGKEHQHLLYDDFGNLSAIGKAALLEGYNQGFATGLKKSFNKYVETGNLDYLKLYIDVSAANRLNATREKENQYNPLEDSYAYPILENVTTRLINPHFENLGRLNEIVVTPQGNYINSAYAYEDEPESELESGLIKSNSTKNNTNENITNSKNILKTKKAKREKKLNQEKIKQASTSDSIKKTVEPFESIPLDNILLALQNDEERIEEVLQETYKDLNKDSDKKESKQNNEIINIKNPGRYPIILNTRDLYIPTTIDSAITSSLLNKSAKGGYINKYDGKTENTQQLLLINNSYPRLTLLLNNSILRNAPLPVINWGLGLVPTNRINVIVPRFFNASARPTVVPTLKRNLLHTITRPVPGFIVNNYRI